MPVQVHEYDELKLRLQRGQAGAYRVYGTASSGEASGSLELPFSDLELENFILRVSRSPRGRRRLESPETNTAKRFGAQLFDALFREGIRDLYHTASAAADSGGRGLRITLYLTDVPELMHIPWEFLYEDPNFLAISAWTPVVRYLDLPRQRRPLTVQLPLRILAMVSSPVDAPPLEVAAERENLERALQMLIDAGAVQLRWLSRATLGELLRELRRETYHVFHFIGHGLYDNDAGDGVLLLEGEGDRGRPVSGSDLGTILHDCTSMRLAVLNACEGARTARDDPFAGVAASLVQREIPAVIAMQFEITDDAAVVFAEGFYEAVAAGYPVDAALAEARKAIFASHSGIEWGTPVLFMRVADGRIFDISTPPAALPATRLLVTLGADPAEIAAGDTVTWRVSARNEGSSPVSDLTVVDSDGRQLADGLELAAHAEYSSAWVSRPERDLDEIVTVGGRDEHGLPVNVQATAHVTVRQPPPRVAVAPAPAAPPTAVAAVLHAPPTAVVTALDPPPTAVVTALDPPPTVVATARQRGADVLRPQPRSGRLGELVAGICAVLLLVALMLPWYPRHSGLGSAGLVGLALAVGVTALIWAAVRLSVRAATWTLAAATLTALIAVLGEDQSVLKSAPHTTLGLGVYGVTLALAGIALGSFVTVASEPVEDGPPRSLNIEPLAIAAGLFVVSALALARGPAGWIPLAVFALGAVAARLALAGGAGESVSWLRHSDLLAGAGAAAVFGSLALTWYHPHAGVARDGWAHPKTSLVFVTIVGLVVAIVVLSRTARFLRPSPTGAAMCGVAGVVVIRWTASNAGLFGGTGFFAGEAVALAGAALIVVGGLGAYVWALRGRRAQVGAPAVELAQGGAGAP